MVVPTAEVEGVGAVDAPVPPVAAVYHFNVLPGAAVAVKAVAVPSIQYTTFETVGAAGTGDTVAVMAVLGLSHPPADT